MGYRFKVNVESQSPGARRRSREQVEADVRSALIRLLEEGKTFKDLTVDELARAAVHRAGRSSPHGHGALHVRVVAAEIS